MAGVTIRNIDDDLKRRRRAARNGRSKARDPRLALQDLVAKDEPPRFRSEAEAKRIDDAPTVLGRPPLEPLDQKAVFGELSDFVP